MLDHKYTSNSFETNGISALKGPDGERFKLLNQANMKLKKEDQFQFYIAHANLWVNNGK